jgi:hypothetical protein
MELAASVGAVVVLGDSAASVLGARWLVVVWPSVSSGDAVVHAPETKASRVATVAPNGGIRLVHHAEIIVLKGDSYRLKDKHEEVIVTEDTR